MNIQDFENLILAELKKVVENIIIKHPTLAIAVTKGERQGDAISKILEIAFVNETQNHQYFSNSKTSPAGKTKNPFDVETYFSYKTHNELIWIDFKAVNIDNLDSNPDSGTPDKIIKLIQNGSFYLAYVFVFYQGANSKLDFIQKDNEFVKVYFLKDISSTVRITPANQLQVNYSQAPTYRTREEFIKFLVEKKKQSFERRLKDAQSKLVEIAKGIIYKGITIDDLLSENQKQEDIIKKL
jgi:hypothetical protein